MKYTVGSGRVHMSCSSVNAISLTSGNLMKNIVGYGVLTEGKYIEKKKSQSWYFSSQSLHYLWYLESNLIQKLLYLLIFYPS